MGFDNVVFCNDFSVELDYYINKNHKNSKIVIITTRYFYDKNHQKFNRLRVTNCILKFVFMPEFAINNKVFSGFMQSKLDEDTACLVCFASGAICDIVKWVATQKNLPYVLLPASCSSGGYALDSCFLYKENLIEKRICNSSEYVVVDVSVVKNTPKRMIASCYGQIISYYINILDYVFNKVISYSNIDINIIKEIEKIVSASSVVPSSVLLKPKGVVGLFSSLLKIESLVNRIGAEQSSVEVVSLVMANVLRDKMHFGEISAISATVLVGLFYSFFNSAKLNSGFLPNIGKRLHRKNAVFNSQDIEFLQTINTEKRNNETYKFMAIKNGIKGVAHKYSQNIENCFAAFKLFYNDHAVFMQKYITSKTITHAVSMAPDVYAHNNILTFMRNFGLLDI